MGGWGGVHALDTTRKVSAFGAHSNPRAFGLARIRHSIKSPASLSLQLGICAVLCVYVTCMSVCITHESKLALVVEKKWPLLFQIKVEESVG